MPTYVLKGRKPVYASGSYLMNVAIPVTTEYFFQSSHPGNPLTLSAASLFNGSTADPNIHFAFAYFTDGEHPHTLTLLLPKEWDTIPKQIKIFTSATPGFTGPAVDMNAPTKFYAVRRDTGAEVFIGDYTGTPRNAYQTLTVPSSFVCDKIIARGYNGTPGTAEGINPCWGNEWEIVGDYRDVAPPTYNRPKATLKQMFGANGYVWDVTQDGFTGAFNAEATDKTNRMVQMGFDLLRIYKFWDTLEQGENVWAFDPNGPGLEPFDNGGWHEQLMLTVLKARGIKACLCIMQNPAYIYNTWGGSSQKRNRPFVRFVDRDDRMNPAKYYDVARMAFVVAGRYGRNASVSLSVMGSAYTGNTIERGLDLLTYMEVGNELDANYGDKYAYNNGWKQAAMMSAYYDGHKGSITYLGIAMGVKNADPTMKVVMPGLSLDDERAIEFMRGFYDWCATNRGYNIDGTIDLPLDVINYHHYSSNKAEVAASPENEGVLHSCGMPPEMSDWLVTAGAIVKDANRYASGKEMWMTEWGFDVHPYSALGTREFNGHTYEEVAAMWSVRSMLLAPTVGVDRLVWFKFINDNPNDPQHFRTMNQIQFDELDKLRYAPMVPRNWIGDYNMQLSEYKDYKFDGLVEDGPVIKCVRYKTDAGKTMFAVWGVETGTKVTDTKFIVATIGFRPAPVYNFSENTGTYTLQLPGGTSSVHVRQFGRGRDRMTRTVVTGITTDQYNVSYSATPTIISLDLTETAPSAQPVALAGSDQTITWPTSTVSLSGGATYGGSILQKMWTMDSGPIEKFTGPQPANSIILGHHTLLCQTGLTWVVNQPIQMRHDFTNRLIGDIFAYDGNTYSTTSVTSNVIPYTHTSSSSTSITIPTTHPTARTIFVTPFTLWYVGQKVRVQDVGGDYFDASISSFTQSSGQMVLSSISNSGNLSGAFGTSWTVKSLAIFTVDPGLVYNAGETARFQGDFTHFAEGIVDSYNSGTGLLKILTTLSFGEGQTFTSWSIDRKTCFMTLNATSIYPGASGSFPAGDFWTIDSSSSIVDKSAYVTNVNGLIPGVYTFRLIVEAADTRATAVDFMQVTVSTGGGGGSAFLLDESGNGIIAENNDTISYEP